MLSSNPSKSWLLNTSGQHALLRISLTNNAGWQCFAEDSIESLVNATTICFRNVSANTFWNIPIMLTSNPFKQWLLIKTGQHVPQIVKLTMNANWHCFAEDFMDDRVNTTTAASRTLCRTCRGVSQSYWLAIHPNWDCGTRPGNMYCRQSSWQWVLFDTVLQRIPWKVWCKPPSFASERFENFS